MSTYKYKKEVDNDVMLEIIELDPIFDKIQDIKFYEYDGINHNIVVESHSNLYSHEQDKITELVESYSATHPLQIRKNLEEAISRPAMIAGNKIISKYAAMNLYAQKSAAQVGEAVGLTANLIMFLMTGSLHMALYEVANLLNNLPESEAITEAEALEFKRRIELEIAKLG